MIVSDIRFKFIQELKNQNFTIDKTGAKTIEIIGASFTADESSIFGIPNQEYIEAEIEWYESMSSNINDIYPDSIKPAPAAWIYTANNHGEINSNYGLLIFSEKYGDQYDNVLFELVTNPDSRRGSMVYQRPDIWVDYKQNDKNDFICTNAHTYYIRDGKMHVVVQMRSNDAWAGYRNDYAWASYVLEKLIYDYNQVSNDVRIERGDILWQVQNLHMYEKNFYLIDAFNKGIKSITKNQYTEQFPDSQYI